MIELVSTAATSAPAGADVIDTTHHLALPTKSSIPGRAVFTSPMVAAEDG